LRGMSGHDAPLPPPLGDARALQPPGRTESVHARSALVLAPHYDDEVLGCGGLVAALTSEGARVRVLFLSDGSGGGEPVSDRAAYAERRRDESAAALAALGAEAAGHLGLPGGALAAHLPALVAALRDELAAPVPELVLA